MAIRTNRSVGDDLVAEKKWSRGWGYLLLSDLLKEVHDGLRGDGMLL